MKINNNLIVYYSNKTYAYYMTILQHKAMNLDMQLIVKTVSSTDSLVKLAKFKLDSKSILVIDIQCTPTYYTILSDIVKSLKGVVILVTSKWDMKTISLCKGIVTIGSRSDGRYSFEKIV